jgi:hypothetical protein
MQRIAFFLLVVLVLCLAACNGSTGAGAPPIGAEPAADPATQPPVPTDTAISPTDAATQPPSPTDTLIPPTDPATQPAAPTDPPTVAPTASPTAETVPSPTNGPTHATATDLAVDAADVVLYPVPVIYAGDKVTFQLLPHVPESLSVGDVNAAIYVDGAQIASGPLDRRNWNGQAEGIYEWAWDTAGLEGAHQIEIVLDPNDAVQAGDENPGNNRVTLAMTVEVASGQAARDAEAIWQTQEIACCFVHVVSDTAAARDLTTLLPLLESAVTQAANRLAIMPSQKLHVYLIDRIVGQGGFAGTDMVVSYADRRYAGGGLYELLVHEAAHILDQQFAPQRISFLAEGLAVWVSGGHYKPEDLTQRSAALVAAGRYVPLAQLIDDFYPVQHEIGYLEAAGFVTYLIERNGWSTFKEFYSDVSADDGPTLSAAVDANLQRYYGMTLAQIEAEWLAALNSRPADPAAIDDLRTTIRYYDIARRYQETYDPTAHYLSAWLPHPTQVREFGNPADLTRRPEEEINITLEVMLVAADTAARAGDYSRAGVILDSVENILDNNGAIIDPMATSYVRIVRAAAEYGYELHAVTLNGETAQATATQAPEIRLKNLVMEQRGSSWVILSH